MAACPFCVIDEQRQQVLWSGDYVYVMPSNPQLTEKTAEEEDGGHLLVIPIRHIEEPWLLTGVESGELDRTIKEFQRRIVECYAPWCDVRQNYRPSLLESEEKVNHLHWHLLPRWPYDRLYRESQIFESKLFRKLSPAEMAQTMINLRNRLHILS